MITTRTQNFKSKLNTQISVLSQTQAGTEWFVDFLGSDVPFVKVKNDKGYVKIERGVSSILRMGSLA